MNIIIFLSSLLIFSANAATLNFEVQGISNNRGVIQFALWKGPNGFPEDYTKAVRLVTLELDEALSFKVENIEAGEYAVAVYHDENEDIVLNRNVFGIPKEGFGFSRNPRIRLGPPKFSAASFIVEGVDKFYEIKINYP